MSSFEVVVLGVGDTFSERHRPSALLLACDGFQLAIDCPDMYLAAGSACAEIVNVPAMESSLDRIEPGSLIDSYMFHKIRGTQWCPEVDGGGSRMPLAGSCLSPAIIGTFRAWILDGAPCN